MNLLHHEPALRCKYTGRLVYNNLNLSLLIAVEVGEVSAEAARVLQSSREDEPHLLPALMTLLQDADALQAPVSRAAPLTRVRDAPTLERSRRAEANSLPSLVATKTNATYTF